MQKKSSATKRPRIPPTVAGIQVNFCKNPQCPNFGRPATETSGGRHGERNVYSIASAGRSYPVLKCHACGEYPPLKSNQGIQEEHDRLSLYLAQPDDKGCPKPGCLNHGVGIRSGAACYRKFGTTRSGSSRFRCKTCGTTFSIGGPTLRQKQPHKNRLIFSLLMNKMPFKRICETADVGPQSVYNKLEFIARQCALFVAHRERKLRDGFPMRRLYIGVDRQDYVVNWTRRTDKRNMQLSAVGSADNATGYVFGMHLNYDAALDTDTIEADAETIGDCDTPYPFRRYARAWLACDYNKAAHKSRSVCHDSLSNDIETTYADAQARSDIENPEYLDRTIRLPGSGMQIHAEYTLYGHFFLLRDLLGGAEKVRFFLDQDSGMRAACLGAFHQRIRDRSCDAFYVRLNKHLTVDEKKHRLADSRAAFKTACEAHTDLTPQEVKLLIIRQRMDEIAEIGPWKDRWLTHPFPNMSEPEKAVCYLTDYGDYDKDHQAWLYNKASLHAIDCFFMQVRRRLSLLERPFGTASAGRRIWYGYSAYNPESIVKLLAIFRVFYNFCLKGQDGQTPAMRLGLAKGVVALEDIIYFYR